VKVALLSRSDKWCTIEPNEAQPQTSDAWRSSETIGLSERLG